MLPIYQHLLDNMNTDTDISVIGLHQLIMSCSSFYSLFSVFFSTTQVSLHLNRLSKVSCKAYILIKSCITLVLPEYFLL